MLSSCLDGRATPSQKPPSKTATKTDSVPLPIPPLPASARRQPRWGHARPRCRALSTRTHTTPKKEQGHRRQVIEGGIVQVGALTGQDRADRARSGIRQRNVGIVRIFSLEAQKLLLTMSAVLQTYYAAVRVSRKHFVFMVM